MKYRSRMDIIAVILEIAQGGAIKTRIMHKAFLSFPQLKEYLEMLMESDLLEYSEVGREYRTTAKGQHFLQMYAEVGKLIAPNETRTIVHERGYHKPA